VSVTGLTDLALVIKGWLDIAMCLSVKKEFDSFVDTCRLYTCLQNPTLNTKYLHILRTLSVCPDVGVKNYSMNCDGFLHFVDRTSCYDSW
jgi:hypothetical protein